MRFRIERMLALILLLGVVLGARFLLVRFAPDTWEEYRGVFPVFVALSAVGLKYFLDRRKTQK